MSAGRPRTGRQEPYPELSELAGWFTEALAAAGYGNVNQFLQRHRFEKNAVYEVMNGTSLKTLESVKTLAMALGREPREVEPIWFRAKQSMERGPCTELAPMSTRSRGPTCHSQIPAYGICFWRRRERRNCCPTGSLGRHEHLLITGGPDAGKTVLAQDLTRRLARIWLREDSASEPAISLPVIPLLARRRLRPSRFGVLQA
jgi:hypothetical protein